MVAWDALSDEGVEPVVPTMSQQADGYFLFPTFSPQAPDPSSSLGGYELWRKAGVDVFLYVVRGGTPHRVVGSSLYLGDHLRNGDDHLLHAGVDRPLGTEGSLAKAGRVRCSDLGPTSVPSDPWSANHLSTRRYSAVALRAAGREGGTVVHRDGRLAQGGGPQRGG